MCTGGGDLVRLLSYQQVDVTPVHFADVYNCTDVCVLDVMMNNVKLISTHQHDTVMFQIYDP